MFIEIIQWNLHFLLCEKKKKFGVGETEVQDALLVNDRHDQLVIAYHLIIDNKRIWNEGSSENKERDYSERYFRLARKVEIADFFAASSPPHSAFLSMTVS